MLWHDIDRMSFNMFALSSKRLDLGEDKSNMAIITQKFKHYIISCSYIWSEFN